MVVRKERRRESWKKLENDWNICALLDSICGSDAYLVLFHILTPWKLSSLIYFCLLPLLFVNHNLVTIIIGVCGSYNHLWILSFRWFVFIECTWLEEWLFSASLAKFSLLWSYTLVCKLKRTQSAMVVSLFSCEVASSILIWDRVV